MNTIKLTKDTVINGSIWLLGSILELPDDQARLLVESKSAMVHIEATEPTDEKPVPKKKADK